MPLKSTPFKRFFPKKRVTTKPTLDSLSKEVKRLKREVKKDQPELKYFYYTSEIGKTVAQYNGAATTGAYGLDITPLPSQGTSGVTRVGDSITAHHLKLTFLIFQMAAATTDIRVRFCIFFVPGQDVAVATVRDSAFRTNMSDSAIVDATSLIDYDYVPSSFQLIYDKSIVIQGHLTSATGGSPETKSHVINLANLNRKVYFDDATAIKGYVKLIILCDTGNVSGATAVTATNCSQGAVNTGLNLNYQAEWTFTDP